MTTTVQIQDETLKLLKKIKDETHSSSYDEAIKKVVAMRVQESFAGYLKKYATKDPYKGVRDKHDRF